jgi:hypothetical protein
LNIGGVYIFKLLLDVGAAGSDRAAGERKCRGPNPAAKADVLNADVRPYRQDAAAASEEYGRGVDHGAAIRPSAVIVKI